MEIHPVNKVPLKVYVDASLRIVGGYFQGKVYAVEVPLAILNIASIVHLEVANILVAVKTWCKHWSNAVVSAFSHHKMRDPWLTACVRNIWYFTASYNIDLEDKHLQGKLIFFTDMLSCWDAFQNQDSIVVKFLKSCERENACPTMLYPNFSI